MNNKLVYIVAGACLVLGSGASIAIQAFAQQNTAVIPTVQTQTQSAIQAVVKEPAETNETADATDTKDANEPAETNTHGHRPLGGDGVISSISGTTVVIAEESDEGSASYTVDASSAVVTNNGVVAKLSDLKVGDKVFVDGAVNGTNVKATAISLGHPGENKGNDANETPEKAGTPETNDDGPASGN